MIERVADLVGACLQEAGVRCVYGAPVPGLRHVPVATPRLAALLADADGAIGPMPGVALLAGEPALLRVGARPGAVAHHPVVIDDIAELPRAIARAVDHSLERPGCTTLALHVDLDAPAPSGVRPIANNPPPVGVHLPPRDLRGPVVVLAGPGVVRRGQAAALRELAARANIGVLNTWGAKGLFPWASRHHLGTVGLQARDFELAGIADAGLVIASGVDPAESPRYRWAGDGSHDVGVPPWLLGSLVARWTHPPAAHIRRPRLYTELAAALEPHYAGAVAGSPARAVLAVKAELPPGGLVAADPGPAGLWVARTFPTDDVGSVCVPAVACEGFAAAAALVATLAGRRAIAVTTGDDDPTAEVMEQARRSGVAIDLRRWGPETGVDFSHTAVLEDVAGPVVAWT